MSCYKPLRGWMSKEVNESGKRSVVFSFRDGFEDLEVKVPCGQCIGCRLDKSREWAVRCVHEASMYEDNCFITLTFNDDNVEKNKSLDKADFQKFMKRLRKANPNVKIRYFHCGEYGAKFSRPHHHACIFNYDFKDKVLWTEKNGVKLYRSETLEKLWPFGYCTIGDVTFESAAYVARYVMKKWSKENLKGNELYEAMKAHKDTDDLREEYYGGRVPEYVTMSRRPGIGHDWFLKYQDDVFPQDYVIVRGGYKIRPPKYYDSIYDLTNHKEMLKILGKRERGARNSEHNKPYRLEVREAIKKSRTKLLERSYEK